MVGPIRVWRPFIGGTHAARGVISLNRRRVALCEGGMGMLTHLDHFVPLEHVQLLVSETQPLSVNARIVRP